MREDPGQTCAEAGKTSKEASDDIFDSKEGLISVINDSTATPTSRDTSKMDNAGSQPAQSAATNGFDDSCFKTPELPDPNRHRRKHGVVRMNGHIGEELSPPSMLNGSRIKSEPVDSLKKLSLNSDSSSKSDDSGIEDVKPSLDALCDIKPCTSATSDSDKDAHKSSSQFPLKSPTKNSCAAKGAGCSYKCLHAKKFITLCFPKLPEKSLSNKENDFMEEVIIDEFSLLVFNTLDDYKAFKVEEDIKIAKDKEEEAKKKKEETILTPCASVTTPIVKKKVGRKSKAEKAREEEERRRLKAERKEQRKRERREQRKRERRELKAKGLLPKRKEKRTEEEKQRHLEEKQKKKEAKRLEHERKREEKRQLKRQLKTSSSADAHLTPAGPGPSTSVAAAPHCGLFTNGTPITAQEKARSGHNTPVIAPQNSTSLYSSLMMKNAGPATIDNLISASIKRPPSELGDIHRNGVIFPPSATPPAAKMPRLDDSLEEFKKQQLIGIAVKSESNFDQNSTPPSGVVANGLTKNPLSTLDLKPLNGGQQLSQDRLAALTQRGLIGPYTTTPSTAPNSNPPPSSISVLDRLPSSNSLNVHASTSTPTATSQTTSLHSSINAAQDPLRALAAHPALVAMYGALPQAELQAALMNNPAFSEHCKQAYAALAATGNPMHLSGLGLNLPGLGLPPGASMNPAFLYGAANASQQQQQQAQLQAQQRQQQLNNAAAAQRAAGQPPPMLGQASTSSILPSAPGSTAPASSSNTQSMAPGIGSYPSLGIQFPPGAALGSQLAGAALLSGLNQPPVKTSKWCNMHVQIAEAVHRKKEAAKRQAENAAAVNAVANRPKSPLRSNIPSSASSMLSNSATPQINHLHQQKPTQDPRFAQLPSQPQLSLQQQHHALLAQRQQTNPAINHMQPPTSKPPMTQQPPMAQQPPQAPQLGQQQRPVIQQSPQQPHQPSNANLAAHYQQAMLLHGLQQQQQAHALAQQAASQANPLTSMATASSAASLQQQARKMSQAQSGMASMQNPLMSHFGIGVQPGITSGIPPMLANHPMAQQELAKAQATAAGRASATPKQLSSVQQQQQAAAAALARPPSSMNHQPRAPSTAGTAPSVAQAAAAALHPALGAIGLQQQQAGQQIGGIPAGFPIAPPIGPSGSLTNGTSDAAVQAMLAAALGQNANASSAQIAALSSLLAQAAPGNNLSAMHGLGAASTATSLLQGANPAVALQQHQAQQRQHESHQQATNILLQQLQMLEKQHQLQGLAHAAAPNGTDLMRQIEHQHLIQQIQAAQQQQQLLERYGANANLLASALQPHTAASSSNDHPTSSASHPNGLHSAYEQELMRARLATVGSIAGRPATSTQQPPASNPAASLSLQGLGQGLHQSHGQPNLDLAILEQLHRQQQAQQQQQHALLGRNMLGGLAPTAPSPAPSMMFNPAQLMGMAGNPMAAQLYGKMNPAMNAAAAAGKREN